MSHHQRIFKSYETSVYVCVYVYTHTYTYLFPQHFCSSSSVHYPYAELLPYPSNPNDSPSNSRFLIFFLITLLCLSLKTLCSGVQTDLSLESDQFSHSSYMHITRSKGSVLLLSSQTIQFLLPALSLPYPAGNFLVIVQKLILIYPQLLR